jgi:hypothetical protein
LALSAACFLASALLVDFFSIEPTAVSVFFCSVDVAAGAGAAVVAVDVVVALTAGDGAGAITDVTDVGEVADVVDGTFNTLSTVGLTTDTLAGSDVVVVAATVGVDNTCLAA